MTKRNNEWIRAEKNAVMKVWCKAGGRSRSARLIAIVTVWPGRGYLLHGPTGVGWALDPDHAPIKVPCECLDGHKLAHDDVLALLRAGRKNVAYDAKSARLHPM